MPGSESKSIIESSSYNRFCDAEVEDFLGTAGNGADLFELPEEIFARPVVGRDGVAGFVAGFTALDFESQLAHFPFESIGSPH